MGTTTDVLNVLLTADVSKFIPEIKKALGQTEKFGEEAEKATAKASAGFKDLKSALVGLGIGRVIKTSITDAMNAVESESLFETSLGGLSKQARAWSEKLSNDLKLNDYALRKNIGTLYNMTTSMGLTKDSAYEISTSFTQLTEDMASFYNLSSNDVFGKLQSGLTGEVEPLKALGILVDENTVKQYAYATGIAEAGAELTQQQKVLARYQAILGQTANAQGNLARTIDSPSNQMRIAMNDLKMESIKFGIALMPIVKTTLPIFRNIIADAAPIAVTFANGLSYVGTTLGVLESPAARGIAYAGAGVIALNKLKMAVGGTAAGFVLLGTILSYVLGKYAEYQESLKAETDVIADDTNAVAVATAGATESAEELNKKYDEIGKSVKSMLAPFDDVNKLSGSGSTLGSSLVSQEDVQNAYDFQEAYQTAMQEVESTIASANLQPPSIDTEQLNKDLANLMDDIDKVFTGDEDERYNALKDLNERVKLLFGEEWTTFWGGVGNEIYAAFNDFGSEESYNALYNLNEKIKKIPFMDVFQDIGKNLGQGLANITGGFEKLFKGDLSGAKELFKSAFDNGLGLTKTLLEDTPLKGVTGIAGRFVSGWINDYQNPDNSVKNNGYTALHNLNEFMKELPFSDLFQEVGRGTGQGITYLENGIKKFFNNDTSDDWAAEISANSVTANPSTFEKSITTRDLYTLFGNSGAGASPIQIISRIELDGQVLGESVTNYQNDQTQATNGRQ